MKRRPLELEKTIVELEKQLEELKKHSKLQAIDLEREVQAMERKIEDPRKQIYQNLTAWQRVLIARHTARPFALDYLKLAFSDFIELHGDRLFGDDEAMPCGFATIGSHRCMVIAHQKGRGTQENIRRNFGTAHPEGHRKALRLMRLAARFGLPIVTLVDSPGR